MKLRLFKKARILKSFIYIFSTLFLSSCYWPCNFDSGLDQFEKKQKDSFFIGEYVVEKSINNRFKTDKIVIKLNKNGTLEMNNMPTDIFYGKTNHKEINVKGTWRLNFMEDRLEDRYFLALHLKFDEKYNIEEFGTSWGIYIKNNKPLFLMSFGDPDNCTALMFIKIQ